MTPQSTIRTDCESPLVAAPARVLPVRYDSRSTFCEGPRGCVKDTKQTPGKVFPNTRAGAQQLIEFAEKTVGEPEGGVRIGVGSVSEQVNESHILKALADLGIGNGRVSPEELEAVVTESKLSEPTARAVALADEKKSGFLYRKKK